MKPTPTQVLIREAAIEEWKNNWPLSLDYSEALKLVALTVQDRLGISYKRAHRAAHELFNEATLGVGNCRTIETSEL